MCRQTLVISSVFGYFSDMLKGRNNKPSRKHFWPSLLCIALVACLVSTFISYGRSSVASAQTANAAETDLHQALLDLGNVWTVMCVAAHPDDEDGATLTILRRKYGVHTISLFSTFGEGGQNAIGPELYEELGAIRAQETVKAAEIQGSEPHFLGLKDFGFSKSAEEAFRIWGHDEALRRMVLQIRTLQPDVIITNHDTTGGHGHHQATGRLVLEAFDASADPKRFPEQLKTTNVWQAKRLFVRMSYEGGAASKALDEEAVRTGNVITIDRNERDPERGSTYAEQALHALQQHASQGPWPQSLPKDGWPPIRYRLAREAKGTNALSRDPGTFLDGLQPSEDSPAGVTLKAITQNTLSRLLSQREQLSKLIEMSRILWMGEGTSTVDVMRSLRRKNAEAALASLYGITATLKSTDAVVVPNSKAHLVLDIANSGTTEVSIQTVMIDGVQLKDTESPSRLAPTSSMPLTHEPLVSANEPINIPRSAHLYDPQFFGREFHASIHVLVNGIRFELQASTTVDVAPAVEIARITPSPFVLVPNSLNQPITMKVRLVNHQDKPFNGEFRLASRVTHINRTGDKITLTAKETREFTIRSNVIPIANPPNRADFDSIIISVHLLESTAVISQMEARVTYSDARVATNLRVGYVHSYDDTLRNALAALGVESRELSMDDIRSSDLQKFSTIIIDNRGYQAHPELIAVNSRLMEYTKNGGTLIVFYHKTNEWNADPAKSRPSLAPFPITLGNERVTDEDATVTFTEPLHPLLNTPNKIGQEDFKNWIQERGLYYPKSWDAKYQSLFAMNDEGEAPLRGGLLVADYGKGHYIYTSMVWYRQLRAGVPGGYRIFANMLSYGKSKK